ncbi:hypothetical protein [Streptosporangium sp. NPDC051022]|uniref:hypothetical protein n=1 Tax=Streptosporangium sp. NPDC051022 TaxID=3155752 RepID=UPI00343BDAFF
MLLDLPPQSRGGEGSGGSGLSSSGVSPGLADTAVLLDGDGFDALAHAAGVQAAYLMISKIVPVVLAPRHLSKLFEWPEAVTLRNGQLSGNRHVAVALASSLFAKIPGYQCPRLFEAVVSNRISKIT